MIGSAIQQIRGRIARSCAATGRDPSEITLLAVSKTFSADRIAEAVEQGVTDIGENYVQELLQKRSTLNDDRIRWHFIGHLQSNKVKHIIDWISLIHAVDSRSLLKEINGRAERCRRTVDVLLEVNTTGENSKFGLPPDGTMEFVRQLESFEYVRIAGLMTIGPFLPDPEGSRPMFRTLRELRDQIASLRKPNVPMTHLSMGMTGDFEVAIEEGATIIRIGTAIFGSRKGGTHETHPA
jgi:pyridoxal phosphate enzyme (YggS family)